MMRHSNEFHPQRIFPVRSFSDFMFLGFWIKNGEGAKQYKISNKQTPPGKVPMLAVATPEQDEGQDCGGATERADESGAAQ